MINPKFGDNVICSGWLVKNSFEYFEKPDDLLKKFEETDDCVYVQETYSLIDAPCGGIVIGNGWALALVWQFLFTGVFVFYLAWASDFTVKVGR